MAKRRVLSVGQCEPDHAALVRFLTTHFDVEIVPVKLPAEAAEAMRKSRFDLALVNRKLDEDYSDGLEVVKILKAEADLAAVPVMLISNHPEAHAEGARHGALPGFGKLEYNAATIELLRPLLE